MNKIHHIKLRPINWKAWISIIILVIVGVIYYYPALAARFVGDNDYWSNLFPIIHIRHAIIDQHTIPLYTDLWYGGRAQWQNPLWSFFYFPATLIWLIVPLDWGARIVYGAHIIFSLIAGKKVSSLFLSSQLGQIPAAIILTAPILPALLAGHIEKVLAWGWVLLSIYFLLNEEKPLLFRGVTSGLCWGIVAITGANYYVLYAGLLLIPLVLSFKKTRLLYSFVGGSMIGL
ncbi:MAG TPA: hypothetical protein VLD65_09320, partial [Anaerolineales bacterium]|nr:hypothetical protein [Anaerolineales bacterium]